MKKLIETGWASNQDVVKVCHWNKGWQLSYYEIIHGGFRLLCEHKPKSLPKVEKSIPSLDIEGPFIREEKVMHRERLDRIISLLSDPEKDGWVIHQLIDELDVEVTTD